MVRVDAELLAGRDELLLGDRRVALTRRAGTPEKPILRIEGCASREERGGAARHRAARAPGRGARRWRRASSGRATWRAAASPTASVEVGVVERMIALPSCEALEVGDRLIPLVRDAIRSVDLEARRIDVDLGFVDGR